MAIITRNKFGNREVDPYDVTSRVMNWLKLISYPDNINYHTFKGISKIASELITKYALDLYDGKNLARGTRRGRRSFNHISNTWVRLSYVVRVFESKFKKEVTQLTEENVLNVFNALRDGTILNTKGRPHLCVSSHAKAFAAFWRWHVRTSKKRGEILPDICESLDTSQDRKPKWEYFTLQDVDKMAQYAPSPYYKVLIYFLFDSGVRAPRELMNIRAMDLSDVPNTNHLYLQVRDETSKTFGRKIKLMISSEMLRNYVKDNNLTGEDFIFQKAYHGMTRVVSLMGYKAFGRGNCTVQKNGRKLVFNGVTMYDFRHNSVCHYLPIYKSENQMKYRYGWKKSEMIHYYSEFMGMKDTISEDDMLIDTTKTEIQQELQKSKNEVAIMKEQMVSQKKDTEEEMSAQRRKMEEEMNAQKIKMEEEMNSQKRGMEEKMRALENMILQKFADGF